MWSPLSSYLPTLSSFLWHIWFFWAHMCVEPGLCVHMSNYRAERRGEKHCLWTSPFLPLSSLCLHQPFWQKPTETSETAAAVATGGGGGVLSFNNNGNWIGKWRGGGERDLGLRFLLAAGGCGQSGAQRGAAGEQDHREVWCPAEEPEGDVREAGCHQHREYSCSLYPCNLLIYEADLTFWTDISLVMGWFYPLKLKKIK